MLCNSEKGFSRRAAHTCKLLSFTQLQLVQITLNTKRHTTLPSRREHLRFITAVTQHTAKSCVRLWCERPCTGVRSFSVNQSASSATITGRSAALLSLLCHLGGIAVTASYTFLYSIDSLLYVTFMHTA